VSKKSQAKKERRKKRRAARDARWLPDQVFDGLAEDIEVAATLESFDARITERGWVFDEEASDDESALWTYPPSAFELAGEDVAPVTTILLLADEDAEIAHVVFAGTIDDYQFEFDELFAVLDRIEAYRVGQQLPQFD